MKLSDILGILFLMVAAVFGYCIGAAVFGGFLGGIIGAFFLPVLALALFAER